MGSDLVVTDFRDDADPAAVLRFIAEWVTGTETAAEEHVADHAAGHGSSLIARLNGEVAGLVTVRWTSNNPALSERRIPLVHQLSVAPAHRRQGIGTALLDAAERMAARRGRTMIGITVGLLPQYGPAQRLYAQRGYVPDGNGACRGRTPLREGDTVVADHSLILWLIKDISHIEPGTSVSVIPPFA